MENENFDLENRDLDDIVLDKSKEKGGLKRWALITGSLLMLFVIVIVGYKLFSAPQSPQDKLVETEKVKPQQKDEEFEDVPIVQENEEIEPLEKPQQQPKEVQPATQKEIQKQPSQKSAPTITKKEPKTKPKPKIKPKPKPKPKQKPKPEPKKVTLKGEFFIQVGAFSKYAPSKHFLAKIKKAGFSYQFKTVIKGDKKITRVLVGPFKTKKEALQALKKIKKTVTPSAFIKRMR